MVVVERVKITVSLRNVNMRKVGGKCVRLSVGPIGPKHPPNEFADNSHRLIADSVSLFNSLDDHRKHFAWFDPTCIIWSLENVSTPIHIVSIHPIGFPF